MHTAHTTHHKMGHPALPCSGRHPLSLSWVEQRHHQIMVPPLPNAIYRSLAVGLALAVVGLLAWGGWHGRHQKIERGGVPWP